MDEYFRAVVEEVTNADSVERVNAWADEKTHGKIPTILTEDNREFVTALINAVYFKAAWEKEFFPRTYGKGGLYECGWYGRHGRHDAPDRCLRYYSTPGVEALRMDYRKYAVDNWEGDN